MMNMILILILNYIVAIRSADYCCSNATVDFPQCVNASMFNVTCYSYAGQISCSGNSQQIQVSGQTTKTIVCTEFGALNMANFTEPYSQGMISSDIACRHCINTTCSGNGLYCSSRSCDVSTTCYCMEQHYDTQLKYLHSGSWVNAVKINITCDRLIKMEVIDTTPPLVVYTKKRSENCRILEIKNNFIRTVGECTENYITYMVSGRTYNKVLMDNDVLLDSDNYEKFKGTGLTTIVSIYGRRNVTSKYIYSEPILVDQDSDLTYYTNLLDSKIVACTVKFCNVNGLWIKRDKMNNHVFLVKQDKSVKKRSESQQSGEFSVNWNQPAFNIYGTNFNNSVVVLNKDTFELEYQMISSNLLVKIPENWFFTLGSITVKIYKGVNLAYTGSFATVVADKCATPFTCYLCLERVYRFSCLDGFVQTIFVTGFILSLLTIMVILYTIIRGIMNFCGGYQGSLGGFTVSPTVISMLMFMCCITPANASPTTQVETSYLIYALPFLVGYTLVSFSKVDSHLSSVLTFKKKQNNMVQGSNKYRNILLAILMLTAIPLVSSTTQLACDSSVQISTNEVTCLRTLTGEDCKVYGQVVVTLPYPGLTVCYVVSNKANNAVMGTISVRYIQSTLNSQTVTKFWTSNYEVQTCSSTPCSQDGSCNGNRNCDRFLTTTGNDKLTGYGTLSGSCIMYPGQTTCQSSCGCAGCGCFFCDSACTYGRWSLKPGNSGPIAAKGFGPFSRYPTLETCYISLDGVRDCFTKTIKDPGPQSFSTNYTISVLGTLAVSNIVMPKNGLVVNPSTGEAFFSDTCDQNVPCNGGIGDLQGSTQSSIQNPTSTSFIFLPNYFTPSISGHTMTFTGPASGYDRQKPSFITRKLPYFANSITWDYSSTGDVFGAEMNPGVLIVALNTLNVTFRRVFNEICPVVTITDTRGEYSSATGGWFNVMAKSECLLGSCILTASAGSELILVTPSLNLSSTSQAMTIRFTSSAKRIAGTITCTAGSHSAEFNYAHDLDEPTIILVDGNTTGYQNPAEKFWSGLSIGGRAGFTIGMILLVAAVIGCMVIGAYLFWKHDVGKGIGDRAGNYMRIRTKENESAKSSLVEKDDTELELDEAF